MYQDLIKKNCKLKYKIKKILLEQFKNFEEAKTFILPHHGYKVGDKVRLAKGTYLHGTRWDFENIKNIANEGIVSGELNGKNSMQKYPYCVCVWNLQKSMFLQDYIDLYSGISLSYKIGNNIYSKLVSYSQLNKNFDFIPKNAWTWRAEQTKETRFMPSYSKLIHCQQNQIAFIINTNNRAIKPLLKYDIFSENFNKKLYKYFVLKNILNHFRFAQKDIFFTNRESAIVFGIPSNFIEGILLGRKFEKQKSKIKILKKLFPNAYIANLDGIIIET